MNKSKSVEIEVCFRSPFRYDGTEVHEASACLAALTRNGLEPIIYAPDIEQAHVIDHQSGTPMENHPRRVLNESARIARGEVKPLTALKPENAEALVIPGGFGAAKNLSDFGFKGADMEVNEEIAKVLKDFNEAGKPIALCCIAPIIAAKVFGPKVSITLGKTGDAWPYGGSLEAAASFGAKVEQKEVNEVCVDSKMKIVTSPAFMYNGKFHEIHDGVANMIKELIKLM